jgi:hypothetical protein
MTFYEEDISENRHFKKILTFDKRDIHGVLHHLLERPDKKPPDSFSNVLTVFQTS